MAEAADQNHSDADPQQAAPSSVLIEIKSVPQRSYARDLRLRDGDVIVAIDGTACNVDIAEFEDLLLDARDDEIPVFVTISRDQMFFEIFLSGPLDVSLDYTDAQHAADIAARFANHSVGQKNNIKLMRRYATYIAM